MKRFTLLMVVALFATASTFAQDFAFGGVNWVGWDTEPAYDGVEGYDENPYDNPFIIAHQAPATWSYAGENADLDFFNETWAAAGDEYAVENLIPGDLTEPVYEDGVFGGKFKLIHDETNLYVLFKYFDVNAATDAGTRKFEIMTQPTSSFRHEASFEAASDSASADVVTWQNQAYARVTELGGQKAVFQDGATSGYEASIGLDPGSWGTNENAAVAIGTANHFWEVDGDATIHAICVIPFDGGLTGPSDPNDLDQPYEAAAKGDTILFDVQVFGAIGDVDHKFFWASDRNNAYASNYYVAQVELGDELTPVANTFESDVNVYNANNTLRIEGVQNANVSVYSLTGAMVKTATNVNNTLNISDLNEGIYLVKIDGVAGAFKILK